MNAVINGDTDGSCWSGWFRVEDDCSRFCSLLSALAGCNFAKVGFDRLGIECPDVLCLGGGKAFEDCCAEGVEGSVVCTGGESVVKRDG